MKYLAILANKEPLILYHGRHNEESFEGDYIFLTPSKEYASIYSGGNDIYVYRLKVPEEKIFSFRKAKDRNKIIPFFSKNHWNNLLENASAGEMDWAGMNDLANEQFDDTESFLQHFGYKGMWLAERTGIFSVYLFDQNDAELIGREKPVFKKP